MQARPARVRLHIASRDSIQVPPSDTCNIIECIFVLLGSGYMLSYNILITPIDYYDAVYHKYKSSLMYYIVPVHRAFLLLSVMLMITSRRANSWHLFITVPFLIIFLSLSIYPYLPQYIEETKDESIYFMILLLLCTVCGFFGGIIQCAVTAFCNYLPSQYMKASISGQAMAGIIVCALKISTKLIDKTSYVLNGKMYFVIGGCFNAMCALLFIGANRTKLIKYYLNHHQNNKSNQDYGSRYRAIKFNSKSTKNLIENKMKQKQLKQSKQAMAMYPTKVKSKSKSKQKQNEKRIHLLSDDEREGDRASLDGDDMSYLCVFDDISGLVIGTFVVMCVTFLYFPGLELSIKSQYAVFEENGDWFGIVLVTEYNIFDYIGRQFLSKYRLFNVDARNVWIIAVIRGCVLYPLMFVLYREYIVSDIALHVVNAIGAASNGYLICLMFIFLSEKSQTKRCNDSTSKQTSFNHISATIMTLSLNLGILSGSLIAVLIQKYLL